MTSRRPQSILITGGYGFIGSNFVNHVAMKWPSALIVNLDKMCVGSSTANVESEVKSLERYHGVEGDIADRKLVLSILEQFKIDTVVNFAANSHVDASYAQPVETSGNNVMGMVQLLEACRAYGSLGLFVQISSDEVYGDSGPGSDEVPKTEDAQLLPTNPYAAGKAGCEALLRAYGASFRIPFLILRLNNVFGPRQWADKVVPRFIDCASRGNEYPLMGDGEQVRSWLFVEDACTGIRRVLESGREGEAYNIGSCTEFSIRELAQKIHEEVGRQKGGSITTMKTITIADRPYNDRRYLISSEKMRKDVGWSCEWDFDGGLKRTVAWYLQNKPEPPVHFLIYGSKGWIGSEFCELLLEEGISFTRAQMHIGDNSDDEVEKEIVQSGATHVVCLVGRTHGPGSASIDYLEGGPEKLDLNIRDNLFAVWLLATITEKLRLHLTYVGTGCIFKYDHDHPINGPGFTEEDLPNFKGNSYSVMKGYTDRMMHHFPNVLNARIRIPISFKDSPRNLLSKIHNFKHLTNVPQSLTILPDILPVLLSMALNHKSGTYNMTNPGPMSFSEIMTMWNETNDELLEWETLSNDSEKAQKLEETRAHCSLSPDKILAERKIRPAKDAIAEGIRRIKNSRASEITHD